MSVQELEEKLLTAQIRVVIDYVRNNNAFFRHTDVNLTLKYVIDCSLAYHADDVDVIFDQSYKLDIPWRVLFGIHGTISGIHNNRPKLDQHDLRDERLEGLKNHHEYLSLINYYNRELPDNFVEYYVNIEDHGYYVFWDFIREQKIDLLKTYTSKFFFDPLYDSRPDVIQSITPLKHSIKSKINNYIINGRHNQNYHDYYETVTVTDDNALDIAEHLMNNGIGIKWLDIANHFEFMTMSERVLWYGYFLDHKDDFQTLIIRQSRSEIFFEHAEKLLDEYEVSRDSISPEFAMALIKRRPDVKDKLIYFSLMNKRIHLIKHLEPDITPSMIIDILVKN